MLQEYLLPFAKGCIITLTWSWGASPMEPPRISAYTLYF